MVCTLETLSTELLLKIFKYLQIHDLCKTKQTCKRFNEIITIWGNIFTKSSQLLVTNQNHGEYTHRNHKTLNAFERLRISRNWKTGRYYEKAYLYTKTRFIPWIQLEKNALWVSRGGFIKAYRRSNTGISPKELHTIQQSSKADVCRFVKRNSEIISGQTDGSLWLWSELTNKFISNWENCHDADINSVDLSTDLIVSGSRDNFVKIWKKPHDMHDEKLLHESLDLGDRVWSVALHETLLSIGTAGISYIPTITIYDISRQTFTAKLTSDDRFGAGVLHLKWETDSVLWSCGYDASLRRWDLRTGKCEQAFEDPFESVVYCFDYDFLCTLISGVQNNGRVVLWDTRQANYVQMYFMESCKRRGGSSPIYGVSFDAEFLFALTDQHVNVLKFSSYNGQFRDYSNIFM